MFGGLPKTPELRLTLAGNRHSLGLSAMRLPVFFTALLLSGFFARIPSQAMDLRHALVVVPGDLSGPERKAVQMLVEEAEKRTQIRWPVLNAWPSTNATVIAVGLARQLGFVAGPYSDSLNSISRVNAAEGYELHTLQTNGQSAAIVLGADSRGVLFGVGRLLREMSLDIGSAVLPDSVNLASAPKFPLRGHQLGYRPKCNSYDAWDLSVWEQYIRDLAIFGCNAIELIPPRSDDDATSPHFPRPPMEMMKGMSQLASDYGLDVWIWYPAMDPDYSNEETVAASLKEWEEVFRVLPRIDAVYVPGGDPGHTQPKHLMNLLEKQTESLHRFHPKAQMWVSPQGFTQPWLDEFVDILNREKPDWLGGVVFGPQVRVSLPVLRQLVPSKYPIRHYPDITHCRQCEYPVPDWDTAYAITEGREVINPRPEDEAIIFRRTQANTIGFISYSEGCNDDVNKFVWSALGWNPEATPIEILRDFSRWFIGPVQAEDFAQGLLALEQNWRGPLASNEGVETTLGQFQSMEKAARPTLLKNWRFQQALFRAYYDAYVRRRLLYEKDLENRALERLARAPIDGPIRVMAAAESMLERALTERPAADVCQRIHELGEALFQSISMQLSVSKYQAIGIDRGACLDTLDFPLNNRAWLLEQFGRIRKMTNETERLAALDQIVQWTNPGPGGFYDDLGNPAHQPHLVRGPGFGRDPGSFESARLDWEEDLVQDEEDEKPAGARRLSWVDHAESLYDAPLRMHYENLDAHARYRIRVVYAGDAPKKKIRLMANSGIVVHPLINKAFPFALQEFLIPRSATAQGSLDLAWYGEPGLGGNGRGCQVAEVWLLREPPNLQDAYEKP